MPSMDADRSLVEQWRALLALHAATWGELDRQLHERHSIGASEFEVLELLAEGCAAGHAPHFRVQELAGLVHLSQSALSRLLGRLEKDGLVRRAMCRDDRRGVMVCLTEEGSARHAAARPTQRAVLAKMLTEGQCGGPAW